MRGLDRFTVILLLVAIVAVALRDFSTPGERRPPPQRQAPLASTLAAPSSVDPTIVIEATPKKGNSTGTAFAIDQSGVWLTARHVTESCRQILIQTGPRRGMQATNVVEHPRADVAVVMTRRGASPLPLSRRLDPGQEGFHFGFPRGKPGEAHSQLLGRARLKTVGLRRHVEPVVAWAELRRHPGRLDALSGMSGGPVLDASGRVVGVTIATSRRRGRVFTAAPISVREVLTQADVRGNFDRAARFSTANLNAEDFPEHGDVLRKSLTVAKVICLVRARKRRPTY